MTKKWLETRIITLIKPQGMSNDEYKIQCTLNGVNASVDDPMFMCWVINESWNVFNSDLHQKMRDLVIKGLEQHLILDFSNDEISEYVAGILPDIILREVNTKVETSRLIDVFLREYDKTKIGDAAYKLNKGFGFTSMSYFERGKDGADLKDLVNKLMS